MHYRTIVTRYLRPMSGGSPWTSTLAAGTLEHCRRAALAYGPGASVHRRAPWGERIDTGLHVFGDCGRIEMIGTVAE